MRSSEWGLVARILPCTSVHLHHGFPMKAAMYAQYGAPDVVTIGEIPTPVPRTGEVRVRVHATTVSSGDWRARSLSMPPGFGPFGRIVFGLTRPRQPILGTELSGVVDAVGEGVRNLSVGDEVFAFANARMGSHAEYRCMAADGLVAIRPRNLSFEQAAALSFGGMTMLGFFRRGGLQRGERVLVNGASGTVGSAAVQLAQHFGAEVTAVCSSPHADIMRSLGVRDVIDYTRTDFAAGGAEYDVIVDTVGNAPYARVCRVLASGGRLLAVLGSFGDLLRAPLAGRRQGHRVIAGPSAARVEELHQLAQIAASGGFTPLIDRIYPFAQIVDAHRHVEGGHKRGSVVVTLVQGTP